MPFDLFNISLLLAAAFIAGALNAIAGGGSFLTLPALVFTGMPPVVANATGTVALLPGYVSGAWGFREDLEAPPGLSLRTLTILSLIGGAIGAALLLVTDDKTFSKIVPWLLLLATILFAVGPLLLRKLKGGQVRPASPVKSAVGVLAVSIYGGYFNGGLGILLLALFGLLGQTKLNAMNGMKNVVSALLTAIAVAIYAWGGVVAWPQALVMMIAATAGGYFGARLARRIPAPALRAGIVVIGLTMTLLFFLRG
jgi:uncharacterized membrane protein YfcA